MTFAYFQIKFREDIISVEIYLDGDEVIVYKHSPKYMVSCRVLYIL